MRNRLVAVEPSNLPGEDAYPVYIDSLYDAAQKTITASKAASDGTVLHKRVEAWLTGDLTPLAEVTKEQLDDTQLAFDDVQRLIEAKVDKVLAVERTIWNPRDLYAGTMDLVARDKDGLLTVWDWKRAEKLYPENACQAVAYAEALYEQLAAKEDVYGVVCRLRRTEDDPMGAAYRVRDYGGLLARFLKAKALHEANSTKLEIWEAYA